jgi:hypothetical protein
MPTMRGTDCGRFLRSQKSAAMPSTSQLAKGGHVIARDRILATPPNTQQHMHIGEKISPGDLKMLRIEENDSQDCGSRILLWINVLHGVAPRYTKCH